MEQEDFPAVNFDTVADLMHNKLVQLPRRFW